MPVNSTHTEYDGALPGWLRARDLLAGEDAVKAGGTKYLPRLDNQSDEDYSAYQSRACFLNATRRAVDALVRIPEDGRRDQGRGGTRAYQDGPTLSARGPYQGGIGAAMARFSNDADMLGTSLFGYAKNVVREVVSVGRAGTLVDWEGDFEKRA